MKNAGFCGLRDVKKWIIIATAGCRHNGGRLALCGGTVTLRLHRNPHKSGNLGKEGVRMLTVKGLIAVLAFAGTFFSIGYAIGYHHGKTQK